MSSEQHEEYCTCDACEARDAQRRRDDELFGERLHISGWPEMGQQSVSVDDLYEAFKRRLERERTP